MTEVIETPEEDKHFCFDHGVNYEPDSTCPECEHQLCEDHDSQILEGIVQYPQQRQARFQNLTACTDFIKSFGICPCSIENHGAVYVLTYFNREI